MAKIRSKSKTRSSSSSASAKTSNGIKGKRKITKKRSAIIDALKPKKPPTAFFFFLEDFRKEFQEQNPDVKKMREVGKACGDKWNTMTYEEKVKYYDIATEKRADYEQLLSEYIKKKENGEFDEIEDDSDFDE